MRKDQNDGSDLMPPSGNKYLKESLTVLQVPRLLFFTPRLLRGARGSKQPALFIPGLKAGDASNLPIRTYLRQRNFRTFGWGLGTNNGDVDARLPAVIDRVEELFELCGEPISLVGWSLGGVIAREVARERAELVAQVITYGAPVVGGPLYTLVGGVYTPDQRVAIAAMIAERNKIPIEVPITAIHSRNDGIVSWQACIDDFSPDVENLETTSSHVGMGIDPDVWEIVATRLGR